MSVLSNDIRQTASGEVSASDIEQVDRALIDLSARGPVLSFYISAVFWLLLQTAFGVIASIKLAWPEFLGNCAFLTYGRLVPAQSNLAIYGWASMVGIGTALWILARLSRVALPRPGLLISGAMLWNVGLIVGLLEILAGNGRGFQYLEFPRNALFILFVAYCIVAVWGVILFVNRRPGHSYISASYLIAALFWFPWLLGGANIMLGDSHGVMRAIIGAWYAQNIIGLWLGALGLGAIYYLIPKVLGRPIHSYYLAAFGFWTFAIFSVWTGMQRLSGGPVPAWLITVSIVSAILMLIPVATVTVNYFSTLKGDFNLVYHSPTIRFVFFGAVAYTVANLIFFIGSFRSVSAITQFTWFGVAEDQLFIFAFFTMVMFGAMYYIVPRLVGCEWVSASFIQIHFWGTAYGFSASIILLLIGGLAQGTSQSTVEVVDAVNVHADFLLSVTAMLPLLRGNLIALVFLVIGQLTFALHFLLMLLRLGRPSGSQPTLFAPIHEGAKS